MESVFQLALCIVVKYVLRLASFFAALRGRSALRGFVARFFVALWRGSSRLCAVQAILPLKPVAKAWSLGLLFDRYLHREGIVMDHIIVVGVPSDLGLHLR